MSNTDQNMYSNDPNSPVNESGLVGEPNTPNNSGLAGTPDSPDNSGLVGSGQRDVGDNAGYDTNAEPGTAGLAGAGGMSGTGQQSGELPEQQLLQPGYNPPVGNAGRLQDIERGGPNPAGYSGAPGQPGMPDQAGALDQTTYSSRNDPDAPAGPDADMRSNDTVDQTGY